MAGIIPVKLRCVYAQRHAAELPSAKARSMKRRIKLTDPQVAALLKLTSTERLARGIFLSGWGPCGFKDRRLEVNEPTANRLLSLGLIQRTDIEGDDRASFISITPLGREVLAKHNKGTL